jgi:hypothetical protein
VKKNIRLTNGDNGTESKWETGECNNSDYCCLKPNKNGTKHTGVSSILDPKVVIMYVTGYDKQFDACYLFGKANRYDCKRLRKSDPKFSKKRKQALNPKTARTYKYYNKSNLGRNQVSIITKKNFSFDDKCGYHLRPKLTNQDLSCHEDVCLTHLKHLHVYSTIYELNDWKSKTGYLEAEMVGGSACKYLSIYGYTILLPLLLNFIFNIIVFVDDWKSDKKKDWKTRLR